MDQALRQKTLARFEEHRRAWQGNEAARTLYASWYARVRAALPDIGLGPWIELGSGPGFAREFIPGLQLTDVVAAAWHDGQVAAEALPFANDSMGALVLFDVLHHLPSPARFFSEASRVLRVGGRIVLCEPYISPVSFAVYRCFHDEPVRFVAQPLDQESTADKDPFVGNQAIPTILMGRGRAELERRYQSLRVTTVETLAGLAYPASGGLSRGPLLPMKLWRALWALEGHLPSWAFRMMGFRLLAIIEKVQAPRGLPRATSCRTILG